MNKNMYKVNYIKDMVMKVAMFEDKDDAEQFSELMKSQGNNAGVNKWLWNTTIED